MEKIENFQNFIPYATFLYEKHFQALILKSSKKLTFYVDEVMSLTNLEQLGDILQKNDFWADRQTEFFKFFIVNTTDTIEFVANVRHSKDLCSNHTRQSLNTFDKSSRRWRKKLEYFKHHKNFHGCPIRFYSRLNTFYYPEGYSSNMPYDQETRLGHLGLKNPKIMKGVVSDIIKMMAKNANFTPLFENHITAPENTDVIISTYVGGSQLIPQGAVIAYMRYYFLITPNDPYTYYERLILPFDDFTWYLMFFTFGFAFGSILFINKMPKKIREIIYGKGDSLILG